MGNTCASQPLGDRNAADVPPSRKLTVPPEPVPSHARWPAATEPTDVRGAAAPAPSSRRKPEAAAAPKEAAAATGWGGVADEGDGSDWDADEVDEVQAFDADGGDEVMAFDDTTPASPRDTAAPTTSAESPPPAPELGAQRTAAVITEFAAQAKGAHRAQQARAFARHALTPVTQAT